MLGTASERGQEEVSRVWSRAFTYLIAVNFITAMGFNMVFTTISEYAVNIVNSLSVAGTVSGIFSVGALIMRPFAGGMADRFNKKNLCIIANVFIGIAVLGYSFSSSITGLIFFRALHGILFAISSTVNVALATRYIPLARIGEGIGYFGLGQVVASVMGPIMGIHIARSFGFHALFMVIALLSFVGAAMLLSLRYTEVQRRHIHGARKRFSVDGLIAREVIVYACIGGLFSFGNGIVGAFMVLLADERNIAGIGLFFSVGAIGVCVLRLFAGRFLDKATLTVVVNISLIVTAISMAIIGFAQVLGLLILASILKSIGQGGGQLALQAESVKKVDGSRVGVAISTFYIGADIGQGLGPIIGGVISEHFSYSAMFGACSVLMLGSLLVFNIYQSKSGYASHGVDR